MDWLEQYINNIDNIPRPDWESIYAHVDNHYKDFDQHALWCDIALTWMNKLKSSLNNNYKIVESDNFIIVTSESDSYISTFQSFLERTRGKILNILNGIALDEGFGKHVVLIFDDIDFYYRYLSYYYSEDGEYGLSSGTYLNKGYGHFAFPHQDIFYAETIAAHEMTHALTFHLPMPLWLNEGIAVTIENYITNSTPLTMDNELYSRHKLFWGEQEIQEYWSGESFFRPDQGQELSYHLAQFCVDTLSKDYESFREFANKAHYSDGGEAALKEIFDSSLQDLISQYFGEGNWKPNPECWDLERIN